MTIRKGEPWGEAVDVPPTIQSLLGARVDDEVEVEPPLGGEEARDRLAERAQNALLAIMHRAAVGIGADGPDLRAVVGRRRDFQHGCRRPSVHGVFAEIARRIPIGNGRREHMLAHVHGTRKLPN